MNQQSTTHGVAGYTLDEKIHSSAKTLIYRGRRDSDQTPVIIKVLDTEYPTLTELIRFRNQYAITKNLDVAGIVKPLSLENLRYGFALILEDFGAKSLKDYLTLNPITLKEFLKVAIQIVKPLEGLHHNRIIHKDIKPQNILINPETFEVKITDFSISSLLPRETQSLSNPNFFEGTLAYMSPEQTGRMNRGIDYRTDFYSLGVTFYEMLTGQLPFLPTDPMELVHCHIAKQPVPAIDINPAIPPEISDIVMKLMAKIAEDRYQSAGGILADLEICLTQLEVSGRIESFVIGKQDISERFQIPEKLYGREAEIELLMAAFDRVSGSLADKNDETQVNIERNLLGAGKTEMMLVAGYSGIGKSALVNEVHKPIVRQRGYFISGKFDQFKRNIPFASLIEAFRDLMRQLLTENQLKITTWKESLAQALGENGQVIIEVIPEVELLIGRQPPVAELGAIESQNRFNLVFQNFIRVFTQAEHPLVLFLDDLQWADSASLKLIQLLMSDPDTKYLFLIGAYRDNEVNSVHPLILTLDEIKKTGATVNQIILQAIGKNDLTRLIADALSCLEERAEPLSQLVFQKTEGNPFFATQFLKSLYEDGLLEYDLTFDYWQCDIAKIRALTVSDNVVEFMASQLQKLPVKAQEVLKLAACIGHKFDLETLSIVQEKSQIETATDLWKPLQSSLILPLTEVYKFFQSESFPSASRTNKLSVEYKFLHDRVQQAAYSLIPESNKKETHLKIGRLLLNNTKSEEIEEKIFDIVNHLNIGVDLISSQAEKDKLASLNLIAGRKAKSATAYEPAVKYLNAALGLLAVDSWQSQYDLTLKVYVETVESEYLHINFERAKQLSEEVLQQAKNVLDKVKVYELQILFYVSQNQPHSAIATAMEVLKMLGISLPAAQEEISAYAESLKEELTVGIKRIEDLVNLPVMSDPYQLAALRILMNTLAPAYQANPALLQLVACKMIQLSIQYGNSPQAISGYGYYGVLLCGVYNDLEAGYQFGQLTVRVWEKFNAPEFKVKALNLFNAFVRYWKDHVRETIAPLQESVHSGIETGDLEYAFYNAVHHGNHLFFIGEPLDSVHHKISQYLEMMEKLKLELHISWIEIWQQRVLNLMGKSADPSHLMGESFDESKNLPIWKSNNNAFLLFSLYCCKTMLLYLFKESDKAVEAAQLGEEYEKGGTGLIYVPEYNFYYSLALLRQYPNTSTATKQQYLEKVAFNQKKMQFWADRAPMNFQHKYDLVEAEKARIGGDIGLAMKLYDCAIAGAKEQKYIQEEALANELAAEFYLDLGREKIAQTYLTDAYYCYAHWGAIAKVQDLEKRYSQFLTRITSRETPGFLSTLETLLITNTKTPTATATSHSNVLDLATVMKASLALFEEIVLDKLLDKLMKVILESAGAQQGFLIMEKSGQLVIEAEGSIDREEAIVLQSIPIDSTLNLPAAIINYVEITQRCLVLNNAAHESNFASDPYILTKQPKSILCLPILHKGKRLGILYLENNLSPGVFTPDRLDVLKLLTSQAAISLENALLYQNLQSANQALQQSETQLHSYATQLEQSIYDLQLAQVQLVQSEKMSSLGQLVAGVAHEINNPVGFIHGNLSHAVQYTADLLNHLQLYQENYPNPVPAIQEDAETIELDYLIEDLPKMLSSMKVGTDRIHEIVKSLKNFSRRDTGALQAVDIHSGIDSTLLILNHRLKARGSHPGIQVIKEYGKLPLVECYPGQLNQVFMNLIANAIDALEESFTTDQKPSKILIRTEAFSDSWVTIRIADNGVGMTEDVRSKLFQTFFTTKPTDKGTGLGLSISYQIVVQKHGGELTCISAPAQGTEFIIKLPLREVD
ncbi:MAG: AAA family ATPase [Microcoleus vaginatus WJT46-NPBG5]|jgi:predicted ATPase/signal transduction histidine kinase|nr:AAA family ATPase [Microcoleus vaginatus WJT46-NPBG5]